MNESEVLISHFSDMKKSASDNQMITFSKFLSPDERNMVMSADKAFSDEIVTFYYGGYDEAERTVAVFIPKIFCIEDIDSYFMDCPDENPLCMLEIEKDRFSVLGHRDYLGSLMGLGIKREVIGDIKIKENFCYVFALKSVADYICENLTKVGRGSVNCRASEITCINFFNEKTETVFSSVASLRLDNIVSAGFNLSRKDASTAISSGLIFVDSVLMLKNDALVKDKSKIVFRGKGKIILDEIIGSSKKGRIHINFKKYK